MEPWRKGSLRKWLGIFFFGDGVVAVFLNKAFGSVGVEFNFDFIKTKVLPAFMPY